MKHHRWQFFPLVLSVLCFSILAQAAPKDPPYEKISPPVAVEQDGKLEVVELFWYTCPHCYYFEDYLAPWKKTLPDDVVFVQVPAVFSSGRGRELAQIFYAAKALGVFDKVHKPIFHAIHRDKKTLRSLDDFYAIFAQQTDVSKDAFTQSLNSFSVDMQVRNAQSLTTQYGLTAVPSLVVQGKYRLTSEMTDGYENMFKVVNNLLDRERLANMTRKTKAHTESDAKADK